MSKHNWKDEVFENCFKSLILYLYVNSKVIYVLLKYSFFSSIKWRHSFCQYLICDSRGIRFQCKTTKWHMKQQRVVQFFHKDYIESTLAFKIHTLYYIICHVFRLSPYNTTPATLYCSGLGSKYTWCVSYEVVYFIVHKQSGGQIIQVKGRWA